MWLRKKYNKKMSLFSPKCYIYVSPSIHTIYKGKKWLSANRTDFFTFNAIFSVKGNEKIIEIKGAFFLRKMWPLWFSIVFSLIQAGSKEQAGPTTDD